MKGKFIVVDGMDGVGKGVFLDALVKKAKENGLKVFDVNLFWETNNRLPTLEEIKGNDILYSSEPTYFGVGKTIRNLLISKTSEVKYSTSVIANAYALDRQILYEGLLLPALKLGMHVFQSRSFSTSLVYQRITGKEDNYPFEKVLNLDGNQFALKNAPDYLIIPLVADPEEVIKRLSGREKKDDAIFENVEFQKKVKLEYESKWLKKLFEEQGTKVIYMDAGKTIEFSKQQMIDFFDEEFSKFI
jgi:thymidylate kinase